MNRAAPNTRIPKPMRVPLVIASVVTIAFSAVGMTNVPLAWFHKSVAGFDRISSQDDPSGALAEQPLVALPGTGRGRVRMNCECGVVDSVRRLALIGNAPAAYEITIRMRDESTRVVTLTGHGNWHPRERITLIGGPSRSEPGSQGRRRGRSLAQTAAIDG